MKKQKTFESNSYTQDGNALEWLSHLAKCFYVKMVKMRSYIKKTKYSQKYATQIEVKFE